MNSFPYMPLYWNDMISDNKVRAMSNEELGAYVRLLAAAWHEDIPGTLPEDEETLALLAGVRLSRWRRICGRVLACFAWNAQTSRREQKRMMQEYASLAERNDRRSDAGAKAAAARWGRPSQGNGNGSSVSMPASEMRRNDEARMTNDDSRSSMQPHANGNANALRTDCLSESNSNSESPSGIEIQRARQPAAGGAVECESCGESDRVKNAGSTAAPERTGGAASERSSDSIGERALGNTATWKSPLPRESEVLTEGQALATAVTAGVIPDFATMVYGDWSARGGRDGAGVLVPWARYLAKRWSREGPDWKAGTHRNQGNNHSPLTHSNYGNHAKNQRPAFRNELERDRARTGIESTAGKTLRCL